MARKLQQVPILGLDLVTPDGLAARRPGTMRELHNLRPVTVVDGRPVWRPMHAPGGAVTIVGLEEGETIRRMWVYRTPYRSLFDTESPPPERILVVSDRRLFLLEDTTGNGTLVASTLYRWNPGVTVSAQATVISGRVIVALRIGDEWHTLQVVGRRAFELPIPFPSGVTVTGRTTGGSLTGGLYAVRLSVRLWDGTPGPWSRPYAILLPSTTTGSIEIDASSLSVPGGWNDAVVALRVALAVVKPEATTLGDAEKRQMFVADYYQVGEVAVSGDRKMTIKAVDDLTSYPPIDLAGLTAHRLTARTVYALNGRVWWGNVRQYFGDVPLSAVDVTQEGGSPVVVIKPEPPTRGGVDRPSYASGIIVWWERSRTPGCVYDVYRAQIDAFGAASPIVTGYSTGLTIIEYLDQNNLVRGVTYHYWVVAVHQQTGGRSDPFYLGSATW